MTQPAQYPPSSSPRVLGKLVLLVGNPNCGKSTLFNALTGLRAKVGNYAGVTVERKQGLLKGTRRDGPVHLLDLPGTYSLSPQSADELIARNVLFHRLSDIPAPDLVVVVVDASNLQRNLYFATQVIELGYPTILALNMMDMAGEQGQQIDAAALEVQLGVPVIPTVASLRTGVDTLRDRILSELASSAARPPLRRFVELPAAFEEELIQLQPMLRARFPESRYQAQAEALLILGDDSFMARDGNLYPKDIQQAAEAARARLKENGIDWQSSAIERRYQCITRVQEACTAVQRQQKVPLSDRLDALFTHRVWGLIIFLGLMVLVFQSIFSFAEMPMQVLEQGVARIGDVVGAWIPPGALHSLLMDGVIAGVGAVVVFLPQICLLFLFIGIMEDTGYMARAAFLMDRLMSKVGLHGKSFIPMLSSYACAIPGIMATRTIETPKDRLVTILVAPLMSCSARLPVYTLLIAACIPDRTVFGPLGLQGMTMMGMYLLGTGVALVMAWLFKKTLLKGETPMLILELPPYKRPLVGVLLRHMWDRSKLFLRRAGTVILGISILLWFLATYPKDHEAAAEFEARRTEIAAQSFPGLSAEAAEAERTALLAKVNAEEAGTELRHSFAGRLGRGMEPLIKPLGFDWKIGIGLVASFAAREVFVSTMSLVYNVGEADESEESTRTLAQTLRAQRHDDGRPVYTTLVGVTLMVFYVFALQCVSTVAVVRRETNSWRWPIFQWIYMGLLAWGFAFVVYQGGRLLGWGT